MIRSLALRGWIGARLVPAAVLVTIFASPAGAQNEIEDVRDIATDLSSVVDRFTPRPRRPPTIGITVAPTPETPAAELAKVRFVLRAVRLEGDVMFEPSLFAPLWKNLVGREISLLDIRKLLSEIEETYKKHDVYMFAVAPPGDFRDGLVRIVIYASYIENVVVDGNLPHLEQRLRPYIDKIVVMRPVRISKILRYLLLISDLAGIELDAHFTKIADIPGAAKLTLNVEFTPRELKAYVDNFGASDTGPGELSADGRFNDTFGLFELTNPIGGINPVDVKRLELYGLAQHFPLGPGGFASGYDFIHAQTAQHLHPGGLPLDGQNIKVQTYVDYAFIRSLDRNLIAHLAVRSKELDIEVGGLAPVHSRKRWFAPGATYTDKIAEVSLITDMRLGHGIDGLEATGTDNDYSFVTAHGRLSREISDKVSAEVLFAGQYSFTLLPQILNFVLGGEDYARAFDYNSIAGQDGVAAVFEVNRDIDVRPQWVESFSLFGFVDYGAVWNPPGRWDYTFASLGSVGIGVRTKLLRHVTAKAFVAVPYKDEPELGVEGTKLRFIAGVKF